jgi:hypothetical protein
MKTCTIPNFPPQGRPLRSREQLLRSPTGATYMWHNEHLEWPRALARKLGRSDLQIVNAHYLDDPLAGLPITAVVGKPDHLVIDPAIELTQAQCDNLWRLMQ